MKIEQAIEMLFDYFSREATPIMVRCYRLGLSGFTPEQLGVAVGRAVTELDHLPLVVELRELAGFPAADARALDAWSDVQKTIPMGYVKHIDFEDPLINAVLRCMSGSWERFCHRCNTDDEKWIKQEFVRDYCKFAKSGVDGEICRPLAGFGQNNARPRLIRCSEDRRNPPGAIRDRSSSSRPAIPRAVIKRIS
ncbi:hypothetical protein LF1_48700 [Rubripirellula obstinata]|uniref:Uncharacterized protein n=1 Tax=Rubripirellula obstinata TaxID=406547 RepID=A0A5B1CP42_9BACT|nr:hypothetical protein [Rubripirellula obstinata]KAA1262306.1 hypothetical protein LF1_48700 [Rubripirellula obstinata]